MLIHYLKSDLWNINVLIFLLEQQMSETKLLLNYKQHSLEKRNVSQVSLFCQATSYTLSLALFLLSRCPQQADIQRVFAIVNLLLDPLNVVFVVLVYSACF